MLLAAYLGGYGVIRANCDNGIGGDSFLLPKCLQHSVSDWEHPWGRIVVVAYAPLFQLDMKLTGRIYERRVAWYQDSL